MAGVLDLWLVTLALLLGQASPRDNTGDEPPLPMTLSWTAPEGCPDAATVRAAIRGRAGAPEHMPAPGSLQAEVAITRTEAGSWRLQMRTRDGDVRGERAIVSPDCRELADAASLVLALMINPDASAAPLGVPARPSPPPPSSAPPLSVPPPPPAPPLPPAPQRAAPSPLPLHVAVGAELLGGWRVLPSASAGLGVHAAAGGPRLAVELRVARWLDQRVAVAAVGGAGATFDLTELAAGACARSLPRGRVAAEGCAGGTLARMHGASDGVTDPGTASAWMPGWRIAAAGRVALVSHAALRLMVEGHGLLKRPGFAIEGTGTIFRPSGLSLRAALAVEVLF